MNNKDGTLWGKLVGILIFVLVGLLVFWAFLYINNVELKGFGLSAIPTKIATIKSLEAEHKKKEEELAEVQKSKEVVKYEIARYIDTNVKTPIWSDYINSLIEMYVQLRNIGRSSTDLMELSDFVVDQSRIGLRGRVVYLTTIYKENGVIDRLTKLDFISNVQIPSYQKSDDVFEFQIQGEVKPLEK